MESSRVRVLNREGETMAARSNRACNGNLIKTKNK